MKTFKWALVLAAFFIIPCNALAVPHLVNYQGHLSDSGGNPIDGNRDIIFTIYNASTGGDALWSETQTVTVTDGTFNVLLGSQTQLPADLFYGDVRYLGVQVGEDAEMTPRQQLASVPFAMRALSAACNLGDLINCYTGTPTTRNVGECVSGIRTCGPEGTFGGCVGEVTPTAELCDALDNDCNDSTADGSDEAWFGSTCDGPDTDLCEEGTYDCIGGFQTCSDNTGDIVEICDGLDNNCNSWIDEGCLCVVDTTQSCYSGPVATFNIGECASGTQTCIAEDVWGTCEGEITPVTEVCSDGLDNDCDGQTDEGCPIHYIFVTNGEGSHYSSFGLSSADSYCQSDGSTGSFTSGLHATWTAVLSTTSINAKDRVTIQGRIYNTNNDLVANNAADLWDGTIASPVAYDQNGYSLSTTVWTGTNNSGMNSGSNCADWIDWSFSSIATTACNTYTNYNWINCASTEDCESPAADAIYCISNAITP